MAHKLEMLQRDNGEWWLILSEGEIGKLKVIFPYTDELKKVLTECLTSPSV
jgi:hypothetical protein